MLIAEVVSALGTKPSLRQALYLLIIHQIFLLVRDWSKHITRLNVSKLKLGNSRLIFLNFLKNPTSCKKYLMDNKHNILSRKTVGFS